MTGVLLGPFLGIEPLNCKCEIRRDHIRSELFDGLVLLGMPESLQRFHRREAKRFCRNFLELSV